MHTQRSVCVLTVNCICRTATRFFLLRGAMPAAMAAPGRANGLHVVVVGEGECRPFLRMCVAYSLRSRPVTESVASDAPAVTCLRRSYTPTVLVTDACGRSSSLYTFDCKDFPTRGLRDISSNIHGESGGGELGGGELGAGELGGGW